MSDVPVTPPGSRPSHGPAPAPLEARDLVKTFRSGDGSELRILQGVDLRLERGEALSVVGASGAGKSTLLHILGVLDQPTAGEILVEGTPAAGLTDDALAAIRNRHVGFVFQFHHLLREFDALENVMMPALLSGAPMAEARARAAELLGAVGIAARADHKPRQLSGGEQQRVAVARALVNRPAVLLADEPSGNLDNETSDRLHDLLFGLKEERELAMVLVTHNHDLAGRADRILHLTGGRLEPTTAV